MYHNTMLDLVDTHTHLDSKTFRGHEAAYLERAAAAGVSRCVTIGASDGIESARRAVALSERFPNVWATVGIHPHSAGLARTAELVAELRVLAEQPRVVAIGETGLDYHYDYAPRDEQRTWFEHQIELAQLVKKPLVIHCRAAVEDCLAILRSSKAAQVGGVFHCFSETAEVALSLSELSFMVSFTGIITFPKASALQQAAAQIPLSQIMLETDSPYLAPVPFRGKDNESSLLPHTAAKLAALKGISLEEVAQVTTRNAERFFGLPGRP